jgi:hypothetical protein
MLSASRHALKLNMLSWWGKIIGRINADGKGAKTKDYQTQ